MNYLETAKRFKTKKKLGQNFLVDPEILNFIIDIAKPQADETIIEIGPGLGFVTELLSQKAKDVIAVEIDQKAVEHIESLQLHNVQVFPQDILKTNFSNLISSPAKVVANIPYYITTPILLHLLGEIGDFNNTNRNLISEITIMVQKELGKRMVATNKSANKEWGALSVLVNYWTKPQIVKEVKSNSFWPRPKVDSVILTLEIRQKPLVCVSNPEYFRRIVKASFNFRRKTLKNALFLSGFSGNIVNNAINQLGFSEKIRGEALSIQELASLSDILFNFDQEETSS